MDISLYLNVNNKSKYGGHNSFIAIVFNGKDVTELKQYLLINNILLADFLYVLQNVLSASS